MNSHISKLTKSKLSFPKKNQIKCSNLKRIVNFFRKSIDFSICWTEKLRCKFLIKRTSLFRKEKIYLYHLLNCIKKNDKFSKIWNRCISQNWNAFRQFRPTDFYALHQVSECYKCLMCIILPLTIEENYHQSKKYFF